LTDQRQTQAGFWDHLDELRWRLLKGVIFFAVCFVAAFALQDELMRIATEPHRVAAGTLVEREQPLVEAMEAAATEVAESRPKLAEVLRALAEERRARCGRLVMIRYPEAFVAYLKVSFFTALLFSLPFLVWQLWCFVRAGLYPHETRPFRLFAPVSVLLFAAGLSFGYFVLVPIGLRFLLGYGDPETLLPFITLENYLSFFWMVMLALGLVFQLPLVMVALAIAGIVNVAGFVKARPFVVLGAFIVAALFTPPDVVTQILLAIPILLLYESGVLGARLLERKSDAGDSDGA